MESQKHDLFFILLKLKSYLISLVDDPSQCSADFEYTEEYLNRRFPELKESIIELLVENDINSDCDIAFNPQMHQKFSQIIKNSNNQQNLADMLYDFDIDIRELNIDNEFELYRSERDKALKEIVDLLLQLARTWSSHQELESIVDQYFVLEEEEVLRSEELSTLDNLANSASVSLRHILVFTKKYLNNLIDYYFTYGGDLPLNDFVRDLEGIRQSISVKYVELFKKHGFDPGKM
ncbi:MAG: hypothetical protein JEY94_10685 [Melioribacteraceae bacterium]|nr:hypothetical protein [Melioribacteraceae bacterium]